MAHAFKWEYLSKISDLTDNTILLPGDDAPEKMRLDSRTKETIKIIEQQAFSLVVAKVYLSENFEGKEACIQKLSEILDDKTIASAAQTIKKIIKNMEQDGEENTSQIEPFDIVYQNDKGLADLLKFAEEIDLATFCHGIIYPLLRGEEGEREYDAIRMGETLYLSKEYKAKNEKDIYRLITEANIRESDQELNDKEKKETVLTYKLSEKPYVWRHHLN